MTAMLPDCELVGAYVADKSEDAFRALVGRHIDLVYSTALRQVGDRGIAEEITQNVFITLAWKAPRLAGSETIAGWLHKAAILESKARIRGELRRRRREDTAAVIASLERDGDAPLEALIPLLDEGLLRLKESDRLALVLRYLEDRTLRDVGVALGVEEEAARKRVMRALDRLADFLRRRGCAVPTGVMVAGALVTTAKAAPGGLAATVSNAAISAGKAATGLQLLFAYLIALTKAQTLVLCIAVAVPFVLEWRHQTTLQEQQRLLALQLQQTTHRLEQSQADVERAQKMLHEIQADENVAHRQLSEAEALRDGRKVPAVYRWDDNSPVVRVPKTYAAELPLIAVENKHGKLSGQIKEILQLTDDEQAKTQEALQQFVAAYENDLKTRMRPEFPKGRSDWGDSDRRDFAVTAAGAEWLQMRQSLFQQLDEILGESRSSLFRNALQDWMPVDDSYHGMNSFMAIFDNEHHVEFLKPGVGDPSIMWDISRTGGSCSGFIEPDDFPEAFRPYLEDWIEQAKGTGRLK